MTNESGAPVLPFVKDTVQNYRKSLACIQSRGNRTIFMPHGSYTSGEAVDRDIGMRLRYLDRLEKEGQDFRVEDFEAETGIEWDYKTLHERNLKQIAKTRQ
jgi:hypothetical protein